MKIKLIYKIGQDRPCMYLMILVHAYPKINFQPNTCRSQSTMTQQSIIILVWYPLFLQKQKSINGPYVPSDWESLVTLQTNNAC